MNQVGAMYLEWNTKKVVDLEAGLKSARALVREIEIGCPSADLQRNNLRSIKSYEKKLKDELPVLYVERIELV